MDSSALGNFELSPRIVHVGETISGRITPAVHFGQNVLMTWPQGGLGASTFRRASSAPRPPPPTTDWSKIPGGDPTPAPDKRVCSGQADTRTVTTCTWKTTAPTHGWARARVGIGNPPARGTEEDAYAVLADSYAIQGHVRLSNGRGMAGVVIDLAGATSSSMATRSDGFYFFLVPKGTHTVSVKASSQVCVEPREGERCSTIARVSVPGSRVVDFKASREGTIDGTVTDAKGKPVANATVRVVGPAGQILATDDKGYFSARVPKGTYTVLASRKIDVQSKDAEGKPITTQKEQFFCVAGEPGPCRKTKIVKAPPDQTVDFGLECKT
jgi:carboxypeptidase family protein